MSSIKYLTHNFRVVTNYRTIKLFLYDLQTSIENRKSAFQETGTLSDIKKHRADVLS